MRRNRGERGASVGLLRERGDKIKRKEWEELVWEREKSKEGYRAWYSHPKIIIRKRDLQGRDPREKEIKQAKVERRDEKKKDWLERKNEKQANVW